MRPPNHNSSLFMAGDKKKAEQRGNLIHPTEVLELSLNYSAKERRRDVLLKRAGVRFKISDERFREDENKMDRKAYGQITKISQFCPILLKPLIQF